MTTRLHPPQPAPPDTLESLCTAYNEKQIGVDDLIKRSAPLLERQRIREMVVIMVQLCADHPGRYHDDNRDDLWNDAQAVYFAQGALYLAAHPEMKVKMAFSLGAFSNRTSSSSQ